MLDRHLMRLEASYINTSSYKNQDISSPVPLFEDTLGLRSMQDLIGLSVSILYVANQRLLQRNLEYKFEKISKI